MGIRYKYHAPGPFKSLWIALRESLSGSQCSKEWIEDIETGRVYEVSHNESEILSELSTYILSVVSSIPKSQREPLIDHMFDEVASRMLNNRESQCNNLADLRDHNFLDRLVDSYK